MAVSIDNGLATSLKQARGGKPLRFAFVAKDYRVLLLFGDNIGDFSDIYNRNIADRATNGARLCRFRQCLSIGKAISASQVL